MKKLNQIIKLIAAAMFVSAMLATTVSAQEGSESLKKEMTEPAHETCFFEGEPIVDNNPKRKASKREQQILDKTISVINRFESQKDAFEKLDRDHNCQLDRSEVNKLLSYAKINGFVRSIASGRLITRYDLSHDGSVQWREFHYAVDKALAEKAAKEPVKKSPE